MGSPDLASSAAMVAEIYRGHLKSSGIGVSEISEEAGRHSFECDIPKGKMGALSSDERKIILTFEAGRTVSMRWLLTPPIASGSSLKATEMINNLNGACFPFAFIYDADGISAIGLGYQIVPVTADPMFAVSSEMRVLEAEIDAVLSGICSAASPAVFSKLEFSEVPTPPATQVSSYTDVATMFDVMPADLEGQKPNGEATNPIAVDSVDVLSPSSKTISADPDHEADANSESETGPRTFEKSDEILDDDPYDYVLDGDDRPRELLDEFASCAVICLAISKSGNVTLPEGHKAKLSKAANYIVRGIMPLAQAYDGDRPTECSWQPTPSDADDVRVWGHESGVIGLVSESAGQMAFMTAAQLTTDFSSKATNLPIAISEAMALFPESDTVETGLSDLETASTILMSFKKRRR